MRVLSRMTNGIYLSARNPRTFDTFALVRYLTRATIKLASVRKFNLAPDTCGT
jgi:hypothetical protein